MNTQDKHNYIYEKTGIEPRLWRNETFCADVWYTHEESLDLESGESFPCYPAEQLWYILPNVIRKHGGFKYELEIFDNRDGVTVWYCGNEVLHQVDNQCLHEALLDMVIWCIEQGYIKKEKHE